MPDQKTEAWLKKAHEMGLSDMEIQKHLKNAGWDHDDINHLLVQGYIPLAGSSISTDKNADAESQLPAFQELVKHAWLRINKHRKHYLVISLLFAVIGVFLYFITSLLLSGAYFGFGIVGMDVQPENKLFAAASGFGLGLLSTIIMGGLGSLLFAWMQATFVTMLTMTPDEFSIGDVLRTSSKKILPYWWITTLVMLLVGGASNLFLIPGIIFSVWFSFAIFMPSTERLQGITALLKSKEYIRGMWWQVFGRYAALYGLMTVAVIVLIIGVWIVGVFVLGSLGFPAIALSIVLLFTVATAFLCVLFVPFALSFSYLLYQKIRLLKKSTEVNLFMSSKGGLIATAVSGWIAVPITLIIIIGLTSSLYGNLTAESRNATRQADIYTIHNALELYYGDNKQYPQRLSTLTAGYIKFLPTDPADTYQSYIYQIDTQQGTYTICASLEQTDTTHERIFCLDKGGNRLNE